MHIRLVIHVVCVANVKALVAIHIMWLVIVIRKDKMTMFLLILYILLLMICLVIQHYILHNQVIMDITNANVNSHDNSISTTGGSAPISVDELYGFPLDHKIALQLKFLMKNTLLDHC